MRVMKSLIAAMAVVGSLASATADETGVAVIHEWQRVGGKICFTGHFHDASGSGASQPLAMAAAVKAWTNYTDFEYGSDWAAFSNSAKRSSSCSRQSDGYSCSVHSIPCKNASAVSHRRVGGKHASN